jgi:hypothetical protein
MFLFLLCQGFIGEDPIEYFMPRIEVFQDENTFLAEMPGELITKGQINKVPWISGTDAQEGFLLSTGKLIASVSKYTKFLFKILKEGFI